MVIISNVTCSFYATLKLDDLYRHLCFMMQEYKILQRKTTVYHISFFLLNYFIQ